MKIKQNDVRGVIKYFSQQGKCSVGVLATITSISTSERVLVSAQFP